MSEFTAAEQFYLASSAEFQKRIAKDSVLNELDESKIDFDVEALLLWEALGGLESICGVTLSPITPAAWSTLWILRSPLCTGKKPEFVDVAIAVYLLTHSLCDCVKDADALQKSALDHAKKIKLNEENAGEVWMELVKMVRITFSPLDMLPKAQSATEPVFDVDWLLSVCSVVVAEAGIPLQTAALSFPLSSAFGLMVIRARKANPGAFYAKHSPDWVSRATLVRIDELKREFLAEHPAPQNGDTD